ncbi:MAG: hypothetical protein R3E79_22180 [Caldilineaceae bacterium]
MRAHCGTAESLPVLRQALTNADAALRGGYGLGYIMVGWHLP